MANLTADFNSNSKQTSLPRNVTTGNGPDSNKTPANNISATVSDTIDELADLMFEVEPLPPSDFNYPEQPSLLEIPDFSQLLMADNPLELDFNFSEFEVDIPPSNLHSPASAPSQPPSDIPDFEPDFRPNFYYH